MTKKTFSFRIDPLLLEEIQQLADARHDGDKSAMITDLILLGIKSLKAGDDVPDGHEAIPREISLAIEARVRESVESRVFILSSQIEERIKKIEKKLASGGTVKW